ncbi:hypothetical protein EJB05_26252, partial [Eragrostis curvula]
MVEQLHCGVAVGCEALFGTAPTPDQLSELRDQPSHRPTDPALPQPELDVGSGMGVAWKRRPPPPGSQPRPLVARPSPLPWSASCPWLQI